MKKIIISGIVAGLTLFFLSILGLYATIWWFPSIAEQYFDPAFSLQASRIMIFLLHPFIISMALAWFWSRVKGILTGSFFTRGIEFGLIYTLIATFPIVWLIYSALSISIEMAASWLVFGMLQGLVAGLIFEKMNP